MEDTYKDMFWHNTFTLEKAWQLVTQLARRTFSEVLLPPRIGVNNTFKVGNNEQIDRSVSSMASTEVSGHYETLLGCHLPR
jgi:hypothetical protein